MAPHKQVLSALGPPLARTVSPEKVFCRTNLIEARQQQQLDGRVARIAPAGGVRREPERRLPVRILRLQHRVQPLRAALPQRGDYDLPRHVEVVLSAGVNQLVLDSGGMASPVEFGVGIGLSARGVRVRSGLSRRELRGRHPALSRDGAAG